MLWILVLVLSCPFSFIDHLLHDISKPGASGIVAAKRCWIIHSAQSGVGILLAGARVLTVGTAPHQCRPCHRRSGTACTATLQGVAFCICQIDRGRHQGGTGG